MHSAESSLKIQKNAFSDQKLSKTAGKTLGGMRLFKKGLRLFSFQN